MSKARHGPDELSYRDLSNHANRVRTFNATCRNLFEYARVQVETDRKVGRTAADIVRARIETLEKTIDRIRELA